MKKAEKQKIQEQIRKKYKIEVKSCSECGKKPALWRFYTKKVLCNNCARTEFWKYLATISILIGAIALYTKF